METSSNLCSHCDRFPVSNKRHQTCVYCERIRKGKPLKIPSLKRTPIKLSEKTKAKMLTKKREAVNTPILKKTPLKRSQTKLKPISEKQKEVRRKDNEYYREAIEINKSKNGGTCMCENCPNEIPYPRGKNVSHIISAGANRALYHDPLNHFILCANCEAIWTGNIGGQKTEMLIFAESEERKLLLTQKYYDTTRNTTT